MHLLCSIINAPVTGCSIREDKARLDFDLPESKFDKEYITNTLNELISKNLDVRAFNVTTEQLQSIPSAIKTVNVAPPEQNNSIRVIEVQEADMQPCGGTHVKNTSEISSITCSKIKKVSRLNRRIEITWQ